MESNKGEIVMYQPDETIRLEVRMGEDAVWLTQQQMADLFQRDQSVIARHIRNIYKEEELEEEGTYAKFAYMGHDGLQLYEVTHYNLDVIISVGGACPLHWRCLEATSLVPICHVVDLCHPLG